MTQMLLNLLQACVALSIGYAAVCRLGKLHLGGRSHGSAVAAQMALLGGAAVLAFGPWLPGRAADPATVPSLMFAGCVLVCQLSGALRWREHAPPDTDRAPLDEAAGGRSEPRA